MPEDEEIYLEPIITEQCFFNAYNNKVLEHLDT